MKKNWKFERNEFLFVLAWGLFIFTIIVGVTFLKFQDGYERIDKPIKLLRMGSYLICILIILYHAYRRNKIVIAATGAFIVLLTCITSSNTVMIWCLLFIVAAIDIDSKMIIQVSAVVQGIMLLGTIALSQVGIIEDHIFSATTRARHGLGFDWATTAAIIYFFFMLQYIYLRREKMKWFEFLILEAVNYILYHLTDSRMAFLAGTLSILLFAIVTLAKSRWKISQRLGYLFCILPVVISVFAILLHVFYNENNALFVKLNSLLSDRLQLGFNAVQTYGITLWGQQITWGGFDVNESTVGYNYVDCSYMQLLLEFGIVFLILVLAIYTYMIYRAIKVKDYYLVWICVLILIFSITEPRLMNFTFNPIPILVLTNLRNYDRESK